EPLVTTSGSATLPLGTLPLDRAGIVVESWTSLVPGDAPLAVSRALGLVSAGSSGGTGAAWQIFAPQDFSGGQLRASFPSLAPAQPPPAPAGRPAPRADELLYRPWPRLRQPHPQGRHPGPRDRARCLLRGQRGSRALPGRVLRHHGIALRGPRLPGGSPFFWP